MKWNIITIVLTVGVVFAEIDDSGLPGSLQDLNLDKLPGNLTVPGNLPVDLSKAPTLEEGEKLLEEKCKKMGHPEAYEAAKNAKDEVQKCILNLVNITELKEEMELAKPTGDLDVVFRKYCRKSPDLQNCITNFTAKLDPCLNDKEKETKHLMQNVTDSVVKFICYKEGDRIALFIAEGGFECLSLNQENIQQCVNSTVSKNLPKEEVTVDNLPSFIFGEEQCRDMTTLQTCIVSALEKCKEPTPANIIDSMFNFVRKMTPCKKKQDISTSAGQKSSNTAVTISATHIVIIASLSLLLLANIKLH